jgi:hypothetical protein
MMTIYTPKTTEEEDSSKPSGYDVRDEDVKYIPGVLSGDSSIIEAIQAADPRAMTPVRYNSKRKNNPTNVSLVEQVISMVAPQLQFTFFNLINPFMSSFLRTMAWHESGLKPRAVGGAGELTAWQILPANIREIQRNNSLPPLDVDDPTSVALYVKTFMKYWDSYISRFATKQADGSIKFSDRFPWAQQLMAAYAPSHPIESQVLAFMTTYNMGLGAERFWKEEWRQKEALSRSLSFIADISGRNLK